MVVLSLETLFQGCKKKYRLKKNALDDSTGEHHEETKEVEFDVKPGYKAGTEIKISSVGLTDKGSVLDLHFVIAEVRWSSFEMLTPADLPYSRSIHFSSARVMISVYLSLLV